MERTRQQRAGDSLGLPYRPARQISGAPGDKLFYRPLHGPTCRVALRFDGNRIKHVEAGPAFEPEQWAEVSATIDRLLQKPPDIVGR